LASTTTPLVIDRPKPKCCYLHCTETSVGVYRGKPFCRTHMEMGKFIDWWIDYMVTQGPVREENSILDEVSRI